VTLNERAVQAWSVLALAARNRQVLNYHLVSRLVGIPTNGIGRLLGPIQAYCMDRGLPPLTSLVVGRDSGLPGSGFIAAENLPAAQARVFEYDWLEHGCPSADEFAGAVARMPNYEADVGEVV
jgi:hypothetical protein